ncbi:MAG: hypothetical protein AVDCRST_MAG73-1582 [uncultured Thermomicrobiales bacterium]|uniref:Uncharacterized protein n=1 Tax=uncultured Thermomicrobiales bacterium TaxID=1645740 RepID=A0A6J4U1Q6_9BACT|nr:MAG: hypothetical protein AVDCRST_MAG73-1582 [uncultured Thermomicrobiales bacterium]
MVASGTATAVITLDRDLAGLAPDTRRPSSTLSLGLDHAEGCAESAD